MCAGGSRPGHLSPLDDGLDTDAASARRGSASDRSRQYPGVTAGAGRVRMIGR